MLRYLFIMPIVAMLAGCASDPNSRWYEGGMMRYEVVEIGPRQYKLFAHGAGAHKKEEVERAFLLRAGELCNGHEFSHEFQTTPYQYGSSGGGLSFTHNAFRTTGVIKCT